MNKSFSAALFCGFFVILSVSVFLKEGISQRSLELLVLSAVSAAAAASDLRTRRVPDVLVFSGIGIRGIFLILTGASFLTSLLSALFTAVPVLLLTLIADRVLKKNTLGGGDIKLIFMLALYFPFIVDLYGLLFSCVLGVVTIIVCLIKRKENQAFPFGPALTLGFFLAFLVLPE